MLKGSVLFTIYVGGKESLDIVLEKGDAILIGSGFLHSAKAMISRTILAGAVFSSAFFQISPLENIMHELIQPLVDYRISHVKFDRSNADTAEIVTALHTLCHLPQTELQYELHCIELALRLWRLSSNYTAILESFLKNDMAFLQKICTTFDNTYS